MLVRKRSGGLRVTKETGRGAGLSRRKAGFTSSAASRSLGEMTPKFAKRAGGDR